jgi:hypothetical protein
MKKTFLSTLLVLLSLYLFSQDNNITITNSSAPYPGLVIKAHDDVNSVASSHPIINFHSSDGTDTNLLPIDMDRTLGSIIFSGYTGSTYHQAARIEVRTESDFSTNQLSKMNFRVGGMNTGLTRMTIDGETGNVGIGTTNPTQKLEIFDTNPTLKITQNPNIEGGGTLHITAAGINSSNNSASLNLHNSGIWSQTGSKSIYFGYADKSQTNVVFHQNGGVGIGTTDFSQDTNSKLLVDGKILCEEVEVIADVVPDYVFQKYYTGTSPLKENYIMPTLEEVEAFTKENHHLPEVPSAAKIKEDGLQLKDMTTILLQKVEELTLYTIEQEKRIKVLEAKLAEKE